MPNKVFVLTGATSGIGKALAADLAKRGETLVIVLTILLLEPLQAAVQANGSARILNLTARSKRLPMLWTRVLGRNRGKSVSLLPRSR